MRRFLLAYFVMLHFGSCFGDARVPRVVSLSPSLTEMVFSLGEQSKLVGRSSACDYPAEVSGIEVVGAMGKPSVEKILALKPTAVIATSLATPAVQRTFEEFGIEVHLLPGSTLQDYFVCLEAIGRIFDCREKAVSEAMRFQGELKEFKSLNKEQEGGRPRVYLEIWDRPYMTAGGKSFINDLIEYAGGVNIAAGRAEEYFNCSVEWILESDPEIIICPAMGTGREADVKRRKGWEKISAVKNDRIYVDLDDDLIYRLGPRIIEGIAMLRKIIVQ